MMPPIVETTNWMDRPTMRRLVGAGLRVGFRAFDTARDYANEHIVGQVVGESLAAAGLRREDVFITTKIGNGQQAEGNIEEQIDISLRNLRTDYVDLWMMHWPLPGRFVETWHKMERVYRSGKARAIGMANFRVRHFETLFASGVEVVPHCVQMELHPLRTATDIVAYLRERGVAIQAYSPLCRMTPKVRDCETLRGIADRHGRTVAQVVLRWHVQNKTVPVFKSLREERLAENFDIFGFRLDETEMAAIGALDEDYKYHLESASCPGY